LIGACGGHLYDFYIDAPLRVLSNTQGLAGDVLTGNKWRPSMMDAVMIVFGVGMFVCFLAYTALCEHL